MSECDIKTPYLYAEKELRRLERSYPIDMQFKPAQEFIFQKHYNYRYLIHLRIALVLGVISVLATGAIEFFGPVFPAGVYSWGLRIVALTVLAVGWWYSAHRRSELQKVVFWGSVALCLVALEFARVNVPPYKHLYYSALIYVLIFSFALARLQVRWALPCSSLIFLIGNIYIWKLDELILQDKFIILFMLTAGCSVSVIVCYLLERAVRISYLQRKLLGLKNEYLQENYLHLKDELLIDALTRVANRRGFDTRIEQEWDRAQRSQYSLTLILFDVDFFKQFNDSYGHQAGDLCLQAIASVPNEMVRRAGDSVARYGGEEFVVTLVGTELEDARLFAEELRDRVLELAIPHSASLVSDVVTISCGVAALVPDISMRYDELIKLADNALYDAKRSGRNKVVCANMPLSDREFSIKKMA